MNLGHASTPDNLTHAKELIQSARFDDAILWQKELLASIPEDDDQREHGVVPSLRYLARISHQFACCHRLVVCCQYVMIICSLYRHNRLRLMRPRLSFCRQRARVHCAHPPAYNLQSLPLRKQGGRLWAQPCGRLSPCKLSVLTICPSTIATAMLSVPVSSTGQAPAPAGGKNPARSSHQLVRNAG